MHVNFLILISSHTVTLFTYFTDNHGERIEEDISLPYCTVSNIRHFL